MLNYIGAAFCAAATPPCTPGTKPHGVRGVLRPPGTIAGARTPRPCPGLLPPLAFPLGWKHPMVEMLKCMRGGLCTAGGLRVVFAFP